MNIVVATDDNFVQHCAVMLVSLLENNEPGICVYLLSEGISDINNTYLKNITLTRGGNYSYILVDSTLLKDCPMPNLPGLSHISIATYYRLLIPNLLPSFVSKVIYLDCDIIIRKSIQDLWNTDINGYAIGAVYQMTNRTVQDTVRLNYPAFYGYFNAGVLLINVEYWRIHSISTQLTEYLHSSTNNIIYHDQDALNAVLYNKCFKLSCRWNMLTIFFRKNIVEVVDVYNGKIINKYETYKNELINELSDPTVIHFVSRPKPWDPKCTHPFRTEYYKYLKFTPWERKSESSPRISRLYRFMRKVFLIITLKGDTYFKIKKSI